GHPARAQRLGVEQRGPNRVLPPSLEALEDEVLEQPPAPLIDGIPPQQEAGLFEGELPRLAPAMLKLGTAPAEHIPPDRRIGQQPQPIRCRLPCRADRDRLPLAARPRELRWRSQPVPIPADHVVMAL